MRSNREWMYKRLEGKYLSPTFAEKVDEFIEFANRQENIVIDGIMKCPCGKCRNIPYQEIDTIKLHLYKHGFVPNYYRWTFHGELNNFHTEPEGSGSTFIENASNPYRNMVLDAFGREDNMEEVEEEPLTDHKKFFDMLRSAEEPLYDGCKLSVLSAAARMANIKCEYNISHKAIDGVASLMKDMCPDDNKMTDSFYKTRKLLEGLELPHQKIHVCPKGCMLFWKENIDLKECLVCKQSRYKTVRENGNNSPNSVLIYFPIGPRLQRLYATKSTAKHMRWHKEPRVSGVMSHPCDGEAWKHLDASFPSFAAEPRNVRLGLCTDGFSPFGKTGKQYSCWPVILTPYNLPPGLCLKKPFMFLSLIIPGPKSPKGNLDVFLQPLIEELKLLWDVGLPTYDISTKKNFQMKVALLWTISDFPAYGMLSGWSTAGKLACPYCMENTKAFFLKHGRKHSWFDCHRQFLAHDHVFRKNKSAFRKDMVENSFPPPRLSGEEVWNRVSSLPKSVESIRDGEERLEGYGDVHHWTKQSIFWELPYWSKLLIRHNLDVMHIEKNVFDNVFHTIMDVKGKTKDNVNARLDLKEYCKRRRLEVEEVVDKNGKTQTRKPTAPFVLSKEKRKLVCEWVQKLKFPDGYASNLSRCV